MRLPELENKKTTKIQHEVEQWHLIGKGPLPRIGWVDERRTDEKVNQMVKSFCPVKSLPLPNENRRLSSVTKQSNLEAFATQLSQLKKELSDDDLLRQRIYAILKDESWDFWTLEAIARELNLPVDEVKELLDSSETKRIVRTALVPDIKGRTLYTLRSRRVKCKEYSAFLRAFLAKSFS